jgi:hypothetical protein
MSTSNLFASIRVIRGLIISQFVALDSDSISQ